MNGTAPEALVQRIMSLESPANAEKRRRYLEAMPVDQLAELERDLIDDNKKAHNPQKFYR